ncbi:N-carbamoyl-L-amino-acid hydrolase [Haloferula luteola]|uniref:N-carbamoyl-L-amino-acid hydrolase n=1 Tax=Haloferula luteola TaxID=595692 RepID=A0A840VFF3_9BACT|nr:N-carbamoyl-L-amino-acid hydrolase [Haloferula luteola]
MPLLPNIPRLLDELAHLATISAHPAPAVTRVLFSEEDLTARAWLLTLAENAGLRTRSDSIGNLFITLPGSDPSLPAVATGSHTDAIPNAGAYDGVVGVLGGLEALRSIAESGETPRRSIELIMFTAEEPTRFGIGCLGSRMMAGTITADEARQLRDPNGISLEQLRPPQYSGDLAATRLTPGSYSHFIELHIEQGPHLEAAGIDIGLVEKIAAPAAFRLTFTGTGGHAGAVLMPGRHDAFLAAAETALAVETAALESGSPDTVGTTGVIEVKPGAINSIPCHALMEIDFRDTDLAARDAALIRIRQSAETICERRGVQLDWFLINSDPPALCSQEILAVAETHTTDLSYTSTRLISRAYHDSLFMARLCPTAMIFIPCLNGWSHRPDEFSSPQAIAKGTTLLAHTLLTLAAS